MQEEGKTCSGAPGRAQSKTNTQLSAGEGMTVNHVLSGSLAQLSVPEEG